MIPFNHFNPTLRTSVCNTTAITKYSYWLLDKDKLTQPNQNSKISIFVPSVFLGHVLALWVHNPGHIQRSLTWQKTLFFGFYPSSVLGRSKSSPRPIPVISLVGLIFILQSHRPNPQRSFVAVTEQFTESTKGAQFDLETQRFHLFK